MKLGSQESEKLGSEIGDNVIRPALSSMKNSVLPLRPGAGSPVLPDDYIAEECP